MSQPAVVFDRVWKKFRRGERHDSMRDALTALVKKPFTRRKSKDELDAQEFWALRDVSFELQPGEAIGIIGPNGAGKSTSLKLLTRILRPTSGRAFTRGRVGALIEISAGFHPDLTGRENLYLQGAILGMSRQEVSRKMDAIIDFAGIPDFIDTPVKRYSSGMNARLGFAVAAHVDPDVLLIDEVLAVGDFAFQQKCYERLAEFRRSGAAIVFVSHSMQAIVSLCDKAILLRPGRSALIGPVAEMAARYASPEGQAVDPRIAVESVQVTERGSFGAMQSAVAPGATLTLDARIRANAPLPRCRVEFSIVRNDGMIMFQGSPMVDGAAPTRSRGRPDAVVHHALPRQPAARHLSHRRAAARHEQAVGADQHFGTGVVRGPRDDAGRGLRGSRAGLRAARRQHRGGAGADSQGGVMHLRVAGGVLEHRRQLAR